MSNFTPLVPFATDFDGDHVEMQLARLKRSAMVKLAPYLNQLDDEVITMTMEDQAQFSEVMAEILPEYVRNFRGLADANGKPIGFDLVVEQTYFSELVGRIMTQLFAISKPNMDEEKNSVTEPAGDSQ